MSNATPATRFLDKADIAYERRHYDYAPGAERIGLQAAEAIGEPPSRVLKTLLALVDGKPVCVLLPSDREVSMKRLAAGFGGKSAEMMRPAEAERLTGYHVGGISPLGQKKRLRCFLDASAADLPFLVVNGGQRGLQIKLAPADLVAATSAVVAALAAGSFGLNS